MKLSVGSFLVIGILVMTAIAGCDSTELGSDSAEQLTTYVKAEIDNKGGKIFVAARTFRSPDPKKPTITLVAASHAGTEHFYNAHQQLLDKQEIVLFEMPYDFEPKSLKDSCDKLLWLDGIRAEWEEGLKEQYSYMNYARPHFRKADIYNPEHIARYKSHLKTLKSSFQCDLTIKQLISQTPHCEHQGDPFACHVQTRKNRYL
ncbi:hypothetical protein EHM76_01480, partial [bacterium]